MKTLKCLFLSFLLMLFFATASYSQFNFHFGAAIPIGNFADDNTDNEESGGAALGAGIGFQYTYQLPTSGLGLFAGIDAFYNGLKKNVKDEMKNSAGSGVSDITYPKYLNIPVSLGLNYVFNPGANMEFFGNAGIAINFFKMTNIKMKVEGVEATSKFDMTNSIGFRAGLGIILNKGVSIAASYYGLGKPEVKGKVEAGGMSVNIDPTKQKVNIISLTFGFNF